MIEWKRIGVKCPIDEPMDGLNPVVHNFMLMLWHQESTIADGISDFGYPGAYGALCDER